MLGFRIKIQYFDSDWNCCWEVEIPEAKTKEIRTNNDAAISFARSILPELELVDVKKNQCYRILDGLRFLYDPGSFDEAVKQTFDDLTLCGEYEPHTTKLVKEIVKPGDKVIDAGASIGYFTNQLARQAGEKGYVYAFEPTPNMFALLSKNVEANKFTNVKLHNLALWSSEKTINVNGNALGRNNVKGIKLDDILKGPIDFIKMDIDGSEPEALKGMTRIIENSPNLKMVIEYYPAYIEKLGNKPQEMLDILNKYFTYKVIPGDYGIDHWNYYCVRK